MLHTAAIEAYAHVWQGVVGESQIGLGPSRNRVPESTSKFWIRDHGCRRSKDLRSLQRSPVLSRILCALHNVMSGNPLHVKCRFNGQVSTASKLCILWYWIQTSEVRSCHESQHCYTRWALGPLTGWLIAFLIGACPRRIIEFYPAKFGIKDTCQTLYIRSLFMTHLFENVFMSKFCEIITYECAGFEVWSKF